MPMPALPSEEFKIVEQLRNGTRNGYAFQIGGCQVADAKRPNAKYLLMARPLVRECQHIALTNPAS